METLVIAADVILARADLMPPYPAPQKLLQTCARTSPEPDPLRNDGCQIDDCVRSGIWASRLRLAALQRGLSTV